MTPKKLLTEIENREREFNVVTDIVRAHRATSSCKTVWVTRGGEMLREDLDDARELPGIKDQLESYGSKPEKHQQDTINTLFSAAEGVSRAKSLAYFEEVKSLKEHLEGLARKDEEEGTSTVIKCGGQQGLVLPGLGDETTAPAGWRPQVAAEAAAETSRQVGRSIPDDGGPELELSQETQDAFAAMRARMQSVLGDQAQRRRPPAQPG